MQLLPRQLAPRAHLFYYIQNNANYTSKECHVPVGKWGLHFGFRRRFLKLVFECCAVCVLSWDHKRKP